MIQRLLIFALAITLTVGCATSKEAPSAATSVAKPMAKKTMESEATPTTDMSASIAGDWEYKITGLPDGDTSGTLTLAKGADGFTGSVSGDAGTTDLSAIVIENNLLKSSKFEVQGYSINMSGAFEGNSFKGEISVSGYDFPMTATKKQ